MNPYEPSSRSHNRSGRNDNLNNPNLRTAAERDQHREQHGFEGPRERRDHLPFFRPFRPETPPIITALWVSLGYFVATAAWFGISATGYIVQSHWISPLPKGEQANIELILNTIPLDRWAVSVIVSLPVMVFWFIIVLFLIYSRLDRRARRDFLEAIRRAVIDRDAIGDTDEWDRGGEQLQPQAAMQRPSVFQRHQEPSASLPYLSGALQPETMGPGLAQSSISPETGHPRISFAPSFNPSAPPNFGNKYAERRDRKRDHAISAAVNTQRRHSPDGNESLFGAGRGANPNAMSPEKMQTIQRQIMEMEKRNNKHGRRTMN